MKILVFLLSIIFAIAVIISACTWTSGIGDELVFPEKNISFLLHVKPFLQQNCSYSPCHGVNFAGGICLLEYHHLMTGLLVVPVDPDGSRLVQILEKTLPHYTNFYRGNIKENHIKGIRQWIKEGAINN